MAIEIVEPILATGRRKTSVAQVRLMPNGSGKITVNAKPVAEYFQGYGRQASHLMAPLGAAESAKSFDFFIRVAGGGVTGQAGAVRHGIARALAQVDEALKRAMRQGGFLTRDSRMVERKKPGRPKAHKRFQYSKR